MADFFDSVAEWLTEEALSEHSFEETLKAFADRLLDGGVPLARINVGRIMLHPAIGLIDTEWEAETGLVQSAIVDRSQVTPTLGIDRPFGDMVLNNLGKIEANLEDPKDRARYSLFENLAARGYSGYAAHTRTFGQKQRVFEGVTEDFRGTSMSFATKRRGGFTTEEREGLERLSSPLAVCLRIASDRFLTQELLSHYLGRGTAERVYAGRSARGDGEEIECILFFSDMRNSLALSEDLPPSAYLAAVNQFFDCTAGAVLDHGGEVLKFMGDGVLAIFPIVEGRRPKKNMARAAIAAARDAFGRASDINKSAGKDQPEIRFGVALHVGKVIYGNVGTAKRHDFTATGAAVGVVARMEAMTKELDRPLLASQELAEVSEENGEALGAFALRGFDSTIDLVAFDLPV